MSDLDSPARDKTDHDTLENGGSADLNGDARSEDGDLFGDDDEDQEDQRYSQMLQR